MKFNILLLSLSLVGFGCAQKTNETPFVLPTNQPPPPIVNAGTNAPQTFPVVIYLVALNETPAWEKAKTTPGAVEIGCTDYAVPVRLQTTGNPVATLRSSLEKLFSLTRAEAEAQGGLYTALSEMGARVGEISRRADGVYVVNLEGSFHGVGTCEDPRIKQQVEKTIAQFGRAEIRLNGSEASWRCLFDESGECK